MTVKRFWHDSRGWKVTEGKPIGVPVVTKSEWTSIEEFQKEMESRFPHRKPVRIPNGIRMEGECGSYTETTLE